MEDFKHDKWLHDQEDRFNDYKDSDCSHGNDRSAYNAYREMYE